MKNIVLAGGSKNLGKFIFDKKKKEKEIIYPNSFAFNC